MRILRSWASDRGSNESLTMDLITETQAQKSGHTVDRTRGRSERGKFASTLWLFPAFLVLFHSSGALQVAPAPRPLGCLSHYTLTPCVRPCTGKFGQRWTLPTLRARLSGADLLPWNRGGQFVFLCRGLFFMSYMKASWDLPGRCVSWAGSSALDTVPSPWDFSKLNRPIITNGQPVKNQTLMHT